jgi:hypothetical protein
MITAVATGEEARMDEIADLAQRYRLCAVRTADISDPKKANRHQAEMHGCYEVLRETEAGREAIIALMNDSEPSVRCWAAAHSLQWKPDLARRVLEALRDSKGPYSVTAEMTLKEYEKGQLTFD